MKRPVANLPNFYIIDCVQPISFSFWQNMNIRRHSLRFLLALSIALASVSSAAHIHIDVHSNTDQVKQCLICHQLQFNEQAQPLSLDLPEEDRLTYQTSFVTSSASTAPLQPPARGPPVVS